MKYETYHGNTVRYFVALLFNFAVTYGCATIPDGDLQLGPKIVRDMHDSRTGAQALNKGRPIYIEARSYPQMLDSGDIWAGGPVLLNLGREDLSLDALVTPDSAIESKKRANKAEDGRKP